MNKRLFDLFFAGLGLVLLFPLLACLGLLVKIHDGGPILFVQKRMGQGGRVFHLFKLRSMVIHAERAGGSLTVGDDRRITGLGAYLRHYKLDELPQLLNVLAGQMSLVGPRPEIEKYVADYSPLQKKVLSLKPGITDPASLALFDEAQLLGRVANPEKFYREQLVPEKIRINLEYAAKAGLFTDFILILATLARTIGWQFELFTWLKITLPNIREDA